jgi:hypothetical protein
MAGAGSLVARPLNAFGRAVPGRVRGFGMDVGPGDFDGAISRVLRAPRRFDLLGVRGARAPRLEVRVRRDGGRWSPWVPLAVHGDHAPDTGSGERASDPVWAGGCDELQLRAARQPGATLRMHFVAVPAPRRSVLARAAAIPKQTTPQPGTPPPIIPRASWGADAVPPRSPASYGVVQLAFVHHTVNANDYTPEQSASIVLGIAKYHRDTNGWNDIGYNFLVDRYGQVFEGRAGGVEAAVVGAHAQGYNDQSTGVAVIGTFSDAPIPEPAMAVLAQLLGWKMSLHGVPCEGGLTVLSGGGDLNRYVAGRPVSFQRICGHRDGDKTECPGNALYSQLPAIRAAAGAAPAASGRSGSHTLTSKRRPSTSTGTVRATRSSSGGATVVVSAPGWASRVASTSSSSHLVEWLASMKAGWVRRATWAGMVDGTPSIRNSERARSSRRRAESRSGPQATSLAMRLS